jgi:hypothetical protein
LLNLPQYLPPNRGACQWILWDGVRCKTYKNSSPARLIGSYGRGTG